MKVEPLNDGSGKEGDTEAPRCSGDLPHFR